MTLDASETLEPKPEQPRDVDHDAPVLKILGRKVG
jgi:hypothetical protein